MVLLTILIPTYNYPNGVNRILSHFSFSTNYNLEIIICDDSTNDNVSKIVQIYSDIYGDKLKYFKNNQQLGAINNWNHLLELSTGHYTLLLHHDEYPEKTSFVSDLLSILQTNNYDILILGCLIKNNKSKNYYKHFPSFLQRFLIKYFLTYIFRRNFIGPVSCIIVRTGLYPKFNINLNWFVDVSLYYELLKKNYKVVFLDNLNMFSIQNEHYTISKSLKHNLKNITINEKNILLTTINTKSNFWLFDKPMNVFYILENILWKSFKVIYYMIWYFKKFKKNDRS